MFTANHPPIKVFLSSTRADLLEYRAAVINELNKNKNRYHLTAMEDYTSESNWPKDRCLADVADCDVYVGLFGWRYGFIPDPDGSNLSITELEYRKALETRKEIRIFLMAEDAQGLSAKLMDRGPAAERIDTFRAELEARHIISQPLFRNPDEAAKQVVTALSKIKWPPEAAEPATGGETLRGYLEWIVRTHGELTLVGLRPGSTVAVKLEEVYVALRGDRGGAYELVQSQQLLEDELEELNEAFRQLPDHERRRLRACLLRENPYMLSLSERDKPRRTSQGAIQGQVATITLADAFRDERWLVILGDPGSGKTTLGRWLALKLADTLLRGLSPESSDPQQLPNVSVPAAQVNPEMPYDRRQINLGPARLPMLVRVGEFAQELARAKVNGTPLTLMDWLCKATWNQKPPTCGQRLAPAELDRVFRDFLRRGRAVLLLDGLDEITEELGRKEVVEAIKEFCRDFVPAIDAGPVPATRIQPAAPLVVGRPCENGGNQIVVTSRIAGYHSAPLAMRSVSTVTIEPMRRSAVEHFCETWMHAVHLELHGETESAGAAAAKAAAGLKAALFDAERPGMAEIATNPLLVTNLASLFLARRDSLPRTRAELYQLAIEMLISGWRQTGLKPEEVIYVLAPLAADIHERSPTGLVEEADLTKIVTEHLAKYRGLPTDPLPPHIAVNVREFVQTLKDQVGLIAARSERLFGFLHLTFQEYLAGRHLIGNPQTAVANLLSKLGDPRWREPVLLAIGYAGWRWTANDRQLLLDSLLAADDPLGNFLPRAALLLADGVTEVPELPRSSYQKLVRRLLGAYAAPPARYQFPVLRQHLEDAFLRLRRFGQPEWMDEVLAEAIAAPKDEDLAAAAAALVRQHGWLSLPIVDALAEGLPHDSPEWGWPIEQTLRDLVSPDYPEAVPVAVPVDQAVRDALERLRRFDTGEMLRETAAEVEKLNGEAETKSKELEAQRSRLTELRDAGKNGNADDETLGDETKDVVDAINGLEKWFKVYQETTQRLKDLEAGGEEIRDKLTKAVEKERSDLEYQFFQNPRQYERNLARHAIAASARERFDLRQSLRGRADLRVADLTLRLALEHDARLVERVRQDPRQLAVLMAIYGGYPNCRADQTDAEYRHIAILLQRPDIEREHILDANPGEYVGRFGNHDTIYNMAVYLDQKMNGRVAIGKTPAEFAPTAIYRNSALDGVVLKCLAAGRPSTQWAEAFRQAWRAEPSLRGKADALTALVALGEDVTAELESALADPALHAVAEAALANLARIAEFLRDPVYRAREGIRRDLAELEEPNGWIWTDIADTVLLEMARSADVAVEFKMLTEKAPSAYQAVLRADAWYQAFCSSDDIVYSTAVVLDTVPSAEKMVALLAAAHRAPSLRAGRLPFRWVVELIPAVLVDDETDVPIEALTALDTLHLEEIRVDFEFAMQQVALTKLLPRGERNPLLRPLLATFALSIGEFQQAIELVPELGPAADPFAALVQVALRIEDPYFKSRALAALLPFLGGDSRQQIFAKAREAAALIKNPFRKTRIGELLIPLASEDERPAVLADTEAAARDIADDPDQRGRALARLARWQPTPVALTLWMDALRSLVAIADEEQRADSLQMIGQLLPKNPILADCWLWAVSTLTTKHARARANRQLGSLLLRQPPASLEAKLAANPQAWAPVLLAAAVHDTLARFQPEHSLRGLWLALLAQPANDKIVDALLKLVEDEGMPLTVEAAQAIDALLQARKPQTLELLLPLLQTPTPEVMPQVKRWQHHGNHLLSLSANLLIAEDGRKITDQTMPGLTKLLANGPDRLRLRAELVMRSRIWNAEKQTPGLKVSNLGAGIFERIDQSALEFRRVDIRVASIFLKMSNDYIHDDPIALETWIERVGQNSAANEHIIEILRQIQYLTPRTWPIFLAGLQHGSKPAQLALLESLCRLATLSNRLPAEHRPVIAKIVRSFPADLFADINVLLEPENKIGMVAVAIAEQGLTEAREVTRTADEMLRGKATTLAQVLATEDEVELFKQLDRIGDTFYRRLDGSEPESDYGAAVILDNPTAFPVLLQCLTVTLEQGRPESMWFQKTKALLTVTAKALRLLPSAFARHAEPGRLEPLLTRVVRTSEHANSRRAAITLLSHLRRITKRTVEAFLFALRDDMHVQETALQATERLTLSPEMRASVLQALDDDSAIVAAGAARMLSVIGRQERTPAPVRQEFLAALAAAIQDRKARRAVYRFTGHGNKEEDAIRVGRFGRLDQEFYQAVLHITGVGITV